MPTLREAGNSTTIFLQYIWDGWLINIDAKNMPMMNSIVWPIGEYVIILFDDSLPSIAVSV